MGIFALCVKIFIARIIDVSLATFVTILAVKSKKVKATILGFIDVIIWFIVVKEALNTDTNSIWVAFSYAGGYATGTFIGTYLSDKLIKGKVLMQVILDRKYKNKIDSIRECGYAMSQVDCTGMDDSKKIMLFIELDKRNIDEIKKIIRAIDTNAFIVANETRYVENGFFK